MPFYDVSNGLRVYIGTRQRSRIQQHFADVICKLVAVPDSKVKDFMAAQPETLEVKRREQVVDLGDPLRHAVIIGVFRFEGELEKFPAKGAAHSAHAAISAQGRKVRVTFPQQPQSRFRVDRL